MWTVRPEPLDSADALALARGYFAELTVRYFRRATDDAEIDLTLEEFPADGLAAFLVLRDGEGGAAGCLGLYPTGELTRVFVAAEHRRRGGATALLAAAEEHARSLGLTRLFLDTRHDLVEARAFYAASGFAEVPPFSAPGPYKDHWFEKTLDGGRPR
jgi:GNAT superfamily N-acetyltransferase